MASLYLLYESAAGYAIFVKKEFEDTAQSLDAIQESILEPKTFGKMVTLHAWTPFSSAEEALEQVNAIGSNTPTELLINFLETNLPKSKKKYQLGVYDSELGKELVANFSITHGQTVRELLRVAALTSAGLLKT